MEYFIDLNTKKVPTSEIKDESDPVVYKSVKLNIKFISNVIID